RRQWWRRVSLLFGFAPGGACHAADVAARAVRSYRTLSPLPSRLTALRPAIRRFAFCGAFPGVAPAGRYPAPYPYGARTFLRFRSGGRPADWLATAYGAGEAAGKRNRTRWSNRRASASSGARNRHQGSFIEASGELWECAGRRRWTARADAPRLEGVGADEARFLWPRDESDGRLHRMTRILALSLALA